MKEGWVAAINISCWGLCNTSRILPLLLLQSSCFPSVICRVRWPKLVPFPFLILPLLSLHAFFLKIISDEFFSFSFPLVFFWLLRGTCCFDSIRTYCCCDFGEVRCWFCDRSLKYCMWSRGFCMVDPWIIWFGFNIKFLQRGLCFAPQKNPWFIIWKAWVLEQTICFWVLFVF